MSEDETVGGGAAAPTAPQPGRRPDISDEEVNALLDKPGAESRARPEPPPGVPRAYDLVAADQAVRGRMPVLDRINERWVTEFEARLTALVRRPLDMELGGVELAPYAEWQARVPVPSGLNLYTIAPWGRSALLAVDGGLLFTLVDAYYGGGARRAELGGRETLTPAEQHLDAVLARLFTACFRQGFELVAALDLQHRKAENAVQYVSLATPSEIVVVTHLAIGIGEARGGLDWVVPLAAFDSVREKLAEGPSGVSPESRARWRRAFQNRLEHTDLELSGVLLEAELTVRELLQLRPGDILPVEMPKTATLYADAHALLAGKFGQSRGYNAISVTNAAVGETPAAGGERA